MRSRPEASCRESSTRDELGTGASNSRLLQSIDPYVVLYYDTMNDL